MFCCLAPDFKVDKSYLHIAPLGYERVRLPLCEVADTPFHIRRAIKNNNKIVQNVNRRLGAKGSYLPL